MSYAGVRQNLGRRRFRQLLGLQLRAADVLCELDTTAANPKGAHGHVLPACACVDLVVSFFERLKSCEHGTRFGDHVVFVNLLVRFLGEEPYNFHLLPLPNSIHPGVGLVFGWPVVCRLDVQDIGAAMLGIVSGDVEWIRTNPTDC
jgi:hypothetical protein